MLLTEKRTYECALLCLAISFLLLYAAMAGKKGIQIHSTALLASSWQKSSELLGLLINLPSGQAAGAMKLCRDKVVVDIFKCIPEFSKFGFSCLDNQLLSSFFHPNPISDLAPCTFVEPPWISLYIIHGMKQGRAMSTPSVDYLGNLPLHKYHGKSGNLKVTDSISIKGPHRC